MQQHEPPVETCDLMLTGGVVVTMDKQNRVIDPGAVAIAGQDIVAVGSAEELLHYEAGRTVNCSGKALIPGLVDCHNHLFQGLARGVGEGVALYPWLRQFMWPYAHVINREEAVAAVRLCALEAARSGTTALLDDHYAPADADSTLAVAAAIEEVGLRGVVGRGIFGPPTEAARNYNLPDFLFTLSPDEEMEVTTACLEASAGRRVRVWPAPDGNFVERELVERVVALARQLNAGWHTHCSEPQADPAAYVQTYGERPVEWYYRAGLLGPDATLAHMIWLSERELEQIGETRTGVAHNPTSNAYLGSGVIRLNDLRRLGATVGLGTDGSACSHRQDMFEQMKQSILLQRVHNLDPEAANAQTALELATRGGAAYLGLDGGVLAPGKLGDVVVVDLDRPHLKPLHDTVATLVYAARGSDVVMTIVNGEVIYEDGHSTRVDEAHVMAEAQARAEELFARAGLNHLREPWRVPDSLSPAE